MESKIQNRDQLTNSPPRILPTIVPARAPPESLDPEDELSFCNDPEDVGILDELAPEVEEGEFETIAGNV